MKLVGIGTGPGSSRHLTLGSVEAIKNAKVIFTPNNGGKTRALDTCREFIEDKEIVYLDYPMGSVTEETYRQNAKIIEDKLKEKVDGAFITIGDGMIYSTFYNTTLFFKDKDIILECEPGIPSFLAGFCKSFTPMTEKGDNFMLTDGEFDERVLEFIDSIAILKTGKNKEKYIDILEKYNFKYIYVKRVSDKDEVILRQREEILKDKDYISLIIGRKEK